ncbi:MAG TPA: DUF433 domain-containing protein [Planctomycetaceae bacterium]|nr:DUF433 domain-containing protein [Planctomycetaceae bacterium]
MTVATTPGILNDRIAGTRITVWDVYLYLEAGCPVGEIAEELRISTDQVRDAVEFINRNREYVMAGHQKIEERIARGNPPEVEAQREKSAEKMRAWLEARRAGTSR